MASVPHVNIIENTGTLHYTFGMRLNVEPFGNYDLRMALKSAIKRQELVDKILNGMAHLAMIIQYLLQTSIQILIYLRENLMQIKRLIIIRNQDILGQLK